MWYADHLISLFWDTEIKFLNLPSKNFFLTFQLSRHYYLLWFMKSHHDSVGQIELMLWLLGLFWMAYPMVTFKDISVVYFLWDTLNIALKRSKYQTKDCCLLKARGSVYTFSKHICTDIKGFHMSGSHILPVNSEFFLVRFQLVDMKWVIFTGQDIQLWI